jgi:hypothetical protein
MNNWMPDLGRGWLIVIPIAVVVAICIAAWPSEPQELNHLAIISKSLGSAHVEKVDPPVGPFNIVNPSSRYFKVAVPATKRTYYVEAYYSMWSMASDAPVYRYRYWREMPFGLYIPIKS